MIVNYVFDGQELDAFHVRFSPYRVDAQGCSLTNYKLVILQTRIGHLGAVRRQPRNATQPQAAASHSDSSLGRISLPAPTTWPTEAPAPA